MKYDIRRVVAIFGCQYIRMLSADFVASSTGKYSARDVNISISLSAFGEGEEGRLSSRHRCVNGPLFGSHGVVWPQ